MVTSIESNCLADIIRRNNNFDKLCSLGILNSAKVVEISQIKILLKTINRWRSKFPITFCNVC